ncbi:hypothetical protein LPN04_31345 [Rugamonas sp. A1-17]|nr:hypothetical protein [Rugamonas sp. A1-17]
MGHNITNESIWGTDFAARERRLAIAKVPAMRRRKDEYLAAGLPARGVWGRDVSAMDARSVKRSLRGSGGLRVWWWRIASHVLGKVHSGSMEHVMYDYHRSHHAVTFFGLEFKRDLVDLARKFVGTISTSRA